MPYLRAESVWKRFQLRKNRADSVGQAIWRLIPGRQRRAAEPFWAIRDVSFDMPGGSSLGIIGHNGAGKSTMLKLLTRTMLPTSGTLAVEGRVSALIELGAGFHPDFTGRENIVLNASILGISRREITAKIPQIIEFSGIGAFIDTPVKYYSSGMNARLGFAVAIHVNPEILIVDEVLAVGDEAFQRQCMDRIFSLKREGVSILLVSHDLGSIEHLMDRAVWLDHGQVKAIGQPHDVVRAYRGSLEGSAMAASAHPDAVSSSPVRIAAAEVVSPRSGRSGALVTGDPAQVIVRVTNDQAMLSACLTVTIRRPDGLVIAEASSHHDGCPLQLPTGHTAVALDIPALTLSAGRYDVDAVITDEAGVPIDRSEPCASFQLNSATRQLGIWEGPHSWKIL